MNTSSTITTEDLVRNNLQQSTYLTQFATEMGTYGLLYPWYSMNAMGFSTPFNYPLSLPTVRTSNNILPHAVTCSESPPPVLQPNITPTDFNSENTPNNLAQLSSDSGVSSASSSELSTPLIKRKTRTSHKKAYCMICNLFIYKEGKRSQGPRRHVLQHHVRRPLYQCPHCSHSSFYDKHHVTSHMRRLHRDASDSLVNRTSEFEEEIKKWYRICFHATSVNSESGGSESVNDNRSGEVLSPPPLLSAEISLPEESSNATPFRDTTQCKSEYPLLLTETQQLPSVFKTVIPTISCTKKLQKKKSGFMVEDILKVETSQNSLHRFNFDSITHSYTYQ